MKYHATAGIPKIIHDFSLVTCNDIIWFEMDQI